MELRPLHPDFGVEVIGFDLHAGGSPDEIAALRAAYDQHAMLLFRGQGRVSPERHVEITGWFGPPAPVANDGMGNLVSVLDNAEPAGSLQLPFHSDLTYTDVPIKAICLHAIALPERPTSTTFVSGAAAWRHLPDDLKQRVAGLSSNHFYQTRMPGFDWPTFETNWPIRYPHPRTGEPILFVTEHHSVRVPELDEAESREVLDALFAALYAPARQYEHVWQLDDLLLWDNLVTQHARREQSDPGGGKRALQRVALAEVGFHDLIDRERARQAA